LGLPDAEKAATAVADLDGPVTKIEMRMQSVMLGVVVAMLGAAGQLMQVNCKVGGLAEQIRAQGDQLRALTEVVNRLVPRRRPTQETELTRA